MKNDFSVSLGHRFVNHESRYLTEGERARHLYAIGRTGTGKTTLLRSLALQDILAGRGCCVIDIHGDNAEVIANSIPRSRVNDVIYFDAGDKEHPIGFNALENLTDPDDAELIASELVTMFKGLFRDSWGEWLEYLLKNTLLTLLMQRDVPVTLASVQRMLSDEQYRDAMVKSTKDPIVRGFWNNYFAGLTQRDELDKISSTLNKTGKFTLSPVLRNIIGQWRSGFDMKEVMDTQKILIVNLSKGRIGADNANFLGSLIVSKIISTALRRSEIPEDERVPFYLNVDEFQNLTSDNFASIVSEARKYALSLTIAHQNFSQIDKKVVDSIIKDAGTLIAFKVSFGDNEKLSLAFRPVTGESLESTSDGHFYERTGDKKPELVHGYSPAELDSFQTNSLKRVRRNSRWRYARPRIVIEKDFYKWYSAPWHQPKNHSARWKAK